VAEEPQLLNLAAPALAALISAIAGGIWVNPFGYDLTGCNVGIVEERV
jgi:hypothetical protein